MVEIIEKNISIIKEEPPKELTQETVRYYSKHTKQLNGSQVSKALHFVKYNCIRYLGKDSEFKSKYCFICLPLNTEQSCDVDGELYKKIPFDHDYNSRVYKIYKNEFENFECSCQGYQSKLKKGEIKEGNCGCSHVLALFYTFKLKRFGISHGASDELIELDMPEHYNTNECGIYC